MRIAGRQELTLSLPQLKECGLSARAVQHRVEAKRLFRIYRGVYALVPTLTRRGQFFAAVLACGEGAVLSHLSAAAEHKIRRHDYGPVHVTVPRTGARSRPGIIVHVGRDIPSELIDGLQVTTAARTLTDLADILTPAQLQLATSTAERLNLVDRASLVTPPGRRAVTKGRHVFTRSENERAFLRLCRRHGLPMPEMNVPFGRWEIDALFRAQRLAVEIDAWHTHGNPRTFETDRLKDADLGDAGIRVRRVTDTRLHGEPDAVARRRAAGPGRGSVIGMSVSESEQLWGGETTKAVANFPISGETVPVAVVRWLGRIKGAAARVNGELGLLDAGPGGPDRRGRGRGGQRRPRRAVPHRRLPDRARAPART